MARMVIGDAAGNCRTDDARGNVDPTGVRTLINRGERVRTDLLRSRPGRDNEILAGDPSPPPHRLMTYTVV
jgi:hypothetical protein